MNLKNRILMTALTILVGFSSVVNADLTGEKAPLRVDFNKMIDQNHREQVELRRQLDKHPDLAAEQDLVEQSAERGEVLDFIDVEVGLDHDIKPLVDRRFDSVGAPRVVNMEFILNSGSGS